MVVAWKATFPRRVCGITSIPNLITNALLRTPQEGFFLTEPNL